MTAPAKVGSPIRVAIAATLSVALLGACTSSGDDPAVTAECISVPNGTPPVRRAAGTAHR